MPSPAVLTRRSLWSRVPPSSSAVVRITTDRRSFFCAGRTYLSTGRIDEASHAREALALARHLGARGSEATALCLSGDVASVGGNGDAEGFYRQH